MTTTGPGQSVQLLLSIIPILNQLGVRYATVGALAVSYYGVVRASLDADAIISVAGSKEAMDSLMNGLKKMGLSATYRAGEMGDPLAGVISVADGNLNRVDLILGIQGMEPDAFSRTVSVTLLGCEIQLVGLNDLIAMKLFAGGPLDQEDVRGILNVARSQVDWNLVRRLSSRYGEETLSLLEQMLREVPIS